MIHSHPTEYDLIALMNSVTSNFRLQDRVCEREPQAREIHSHGIFDVLLSLQTSLGVEMMYLMSENKKVVTT